MSPTISTKKTKEKKRTLKSRRAMERERLIFLGLLVACGLSVLIHLAVQIAGAYSKSKDREFRLRTLQSQRLARVMDDELEFKQELEIAKQAQVENLAAKKRAEEFERRLNLDPAFAHTEKEKAMLEMKRIGRDLEIPDKEALERIAKLASPPRSGVMVSKTKKGWLVEVAFPYKEIVNKFQEDYKNFLPGYYREVKMTAAGIIKDLYAFGGARSIENVTVHCQDRVLIQTRRGKKRELRDLLVVYAYPGAADWSRIRLDDVEGVWRKRRDWFLSRLKEWR